MSDDDVVNGVIRGEVGRGLPHAGDLITDGSAPYQISWVGRMRSDHAGLCARAKCVMLDWEDVSDEEADALEGGFTPDPEPGKEVWDDATHQWVKLSRARGW